MKLKFFLPLFILFFVTGCAKEIDRISFQSLDQITKQITINKAKNIELWVDLDIKYSGKLSLLNHILLIKDDMIIAKDTCDALKVNIKFYSVEISVGNNHEKKYQGKLCFQSGKLKTGEYVLKINPEITGDSYTLDKYDIIIKQ